MAGNMPGKSNDEKRKIMKETIIIPMVVAVAVTREIIAEEDGGRRKGRGGCGRGGSNNSEHLKTIECFNCGGKGQYPTDCSAPRKNDTENSNVVSKADFKNLFQSSKKDMLTKKEKQTEKKDIMDVDDEYLDMNVFEKLMEGKHKEIVSNDDGDSTSINSTNNFFHFGQNNMTGKSRLDNSYNNYNDEISYPFSKRIKLKHDPEEAQENELVQYTADIIVEIKIEMVQWYP
jgi:hypothetical protein